MFLWIFQLLLILRAILSWFPMDPGSPMIRFVHTFTEPVLLPVRTLLFKIPQLRNLPIDLSFLVVFLLIQILLSFF